MTERAYISLPSVSHSGNFSAFETKGLTTRSHPFPDEVSALFTGKRYASAPLSPQEEQETVQLREDGKEDGQEASPLDGEEKIEHPRNTISPIPPAIDHVPGSAEAPDPLSHRWFTDAKYPGCPPHPLFSVEQLGVDRRLIVNRKRQLKMYRVWIQGKFRKSLT